MKFCLIVNKEGKVLGREYEKAYHYSSWTSGGDYWRTTWGDIKDQNEDDDDIFKALIFENKKAAEKYIKETPSYYFDKEEEFKVIKVGEL